jgi:hypothetical protein
MNSIHDKIIFDYFFLWKGTSLLLLQTLKAISNNESDNEQKLLAGFILDYCF